MDELLTITLTHLEGPRAGEADAFSQPSIIVGRSPDSHLPFASEKGVSGRHAEIVQEAGRFEVVDHNSTNGTFVNEERVTRRVLVPGDKIRFGYMGPVMQVEWDAPGAAAPAPAAPQLEQFGTVFIQANQLQAPAPAAPVAAPPRHVATPVAAAPVRPVAAPVAAAVAVAAAAPIAARAVAAPMARPAAPVESSMAAAASTAAPAAAAGKPAKAAKSGGGGAKYLIIVIVVFVVALAIVGGTAMMVMNR